MHRTARKHMSENIQYWYKERLEENLKVIDLGSYDVNGTLKDIVPEAWEYCGLDRVSGPNVDSVMGADYIIPFPPSTADLVISSSCFQYVRNPFRLMKSINETVKQKGMIFICAPRNETDGLIGLPPEKCPDNKEQFDCWRFLPDGMTALLEDSGFQSLKTYYHGNDCWGIGIKNGS